MKKGFLRDTRGVAVVEFALILPTLFLLLSGVINFGLIIAKKNELTNVVSVGTLFAFGNSSNIAIVEAAAKNSTNLNPLTVTVTQYCQCIGGAQPGCGKTCADGFPAPSYIQVVASSTVNLIALDFILTNPYPITVQGIIRVS
jgi:uncharacterized membrane protein